MSLLAEEDVVMELPIQELISLNEKRAAQYELLSRLFYTEVDAAFLETLTSMQFPIGTGNTDYDEGSKLLIQYLGNIWENTLTELAVDFVRTFLGRGVDAYSAAYPFESVYTSPKRLLMQEARNEVVAIYRSAGLDKSGSWKEGEDHLALELSYLQILSTRTVAALKNGETDEAQQILKNQRNFLKEHLLKWVPLLVKDIKKYSQTDFYHGAAYLLEGFLKTDYEFINVLLGNTHDDDLEVDDSLIEAVS